MKEKLTLTIEKSIKERAKEFAQSHGTSVSSIVEKYLGSVTREDEVRPEAGSITESLMGSVRLPEKYKGMSYKEIKQQKLKEKYGI